MLFHSALASASLLLSATCFAATLNVPSVDYPTIQAAIWDSSEGDTILIAPGTYEGFTFQSWSLTIGSASGELDVTIDGQGGLPGVWFGAWPDFDHSGSVLQNLVITDCVHHGITMHGSSPTIINCTVKNNRALWAEGAGIYCKDSNPTLINCRIVDNQADSLGGGLYLWNSNATVTDCTFSGNSASRGGGISMTSGSGFSTPVFTGCTISANTATGGGGGVLSWDASPTFTDCTVSDNTAPTDYGDGIGGIWLHGGYPSLIDCSITGNTANGYQSDPPGGFGGGGIYCRGWDTGGSAVITGCTISGNSSYLPGGGICAEPGWAPVLTDTRVCDNSPDQVVGPWTDDGGNNVLDDCSGCQGDLNSDGEVGVDDLLALLAEFGLDCTDGCDGDLNDDGEVTVDDLLALLGAYGTACP